MVIETIKCFLTGFAILILITLLSAGIVFDFPGCRIIAIVMFIFLVFFTSWMIGVVVRN